MSYISLNKIIADSGYCSRREADNLIAEGRVTVNDILGTATMRIMPDDVVAVDFEVIKSNNPKDLVILAYNKPKGLTCTTDLLDRTSIMHFINYQKRIFPIGRLDKDSEGLLLLTNNGDIVNKILRSGNGHDKEYWVTLAKPYEKEFLKKMASGVQIDAGLTKPAKVVAIAPRKFSITLTQGLNRQIRKMCRALDAKVETLQRVRIMNVFIGKLAPGKFKILNTAETAGLLDLIKDSKKTADPKQRKQYIPKRNPQQAMPEQMPSDSPADAKPARYVPKPVGRQQQRETKTDTKKYIAKADIGKNKSVKKPIAAATKPVSKSGGRSANKPASKAAPKTPAKKGSYKDFKANKKR
jgi:23S rRNA pseudouridine2604 synthase